MKAEVRTFHGSKIVDVIDSTVIEGVHLFSFTEDCYDHPIYYRVAELSSGWGVSGGETEDEAWEKAHELRLEILPRVIGKLADEKEKGIAPVRGEYFEDEVKP